MMNSLDNSNADTEQPNNNQSSFGPTNQSSTFDSDQSHTPRAPNTQLNWGAPNNQQGNTGSALPWQTSPWTQQNAQQPQQGQASVGHDGSFNGMNREQWRDAWMGSGNKDQAGTDSWLAKQGATKLADNGTFMTPFGEILDLGIGYRSGNVKPGFTDVGAGAIPAGQSMSPFGPSNGQQMMGPQGMMGQNGQINPQMMGFLQQLLTQNGMGNPQGNAAQIQGPQFARPNLFSNMGANTMDISSLLGAPSSGMTSGVM